MAARVNSEDHARSDGFAVEMYGARAACAAIANEFRAVQPEMLSQCAQQRYARLYGEASHLAIYLEFDRLRIGSDALRDSFGRGLRRRLRLGDGGTHSYQARDRRGRTGALDK
jgi:hypothetical protein